MNEKRKYVIVSSETWLPKTDNPTPMVKLTVLGIDDLLNETFSFQSGNPLLVGIDGNDHQKVVEVETEMVKQFVGNSYKKRVVKILYTGAKAVFTVK